jgi:hypothetical protein
MLAFMAKAARKIQGQRTISSNISNNCSPTPFDFTPFNIVLKRAGPLLFHKRNIVMPDLIRHPESH